MERPHSVQQGVPNQVIEYETGCHQENQKVCMIQVQEDVSKWCFHVQAHIFDASLGWV